MLGFRIPDLHKVAIKTFCKRTNNPIISTVRIDNSNVRIGEEGTRHCYGHQAFRETRNKVLSEKNLKVN